MNKIIKKILIFFLVIGCRNYSTDPTEPVISPSAKSLSSFIYSAKVEAIKG